LSKTKEKALPVARGFYSYIGKVKNRWSCILLLVALSAGGCRKEERLSQSEKIRVIFDTDANNELDDQHALAYLLFNGDVFAVEGVTVNATRSGGPIEEQYKEASRVLRLCDAEERITLLKGANGTFDEIGVDSGGFDGEEAVNFIIRKARKPDERPLTVIAVGKLTNVALAVKKDPAIASAIRIVWLGSNYPEPGEYNQENDTSALNYLLKSPCPFEMVTVRYGTDSGTDAVRATKDEISRKMPGMGPRVEAPVEGRHGPAFQNFGDYSVNLFEHIDYHGDPPSRALFDMAAVAIVKNPSWARRSEVACPVLIDNQWRDIPDNSRKITIWENFDSKRIMDDFYESMEHFVLADSI